MHPRTNQTLKEAAVDVAAESGARTEGDNLEGTMQKTADHAARSVQPGAPDVGNLLSTDRLTQMARQAHRLVQAIISAGPLICLGAVLKKVNSSQHGDHGLVFDVDALPMTAGWRRGVVSHPLTARQSPRPAEDELVSHLRDVWDLCVPYGWATEAELRHPT